MKIGTILVYFAINFFSLSLQNELEIIENVDEIEEPKTLDGVPIDEEDPFDTSVRKAPVEKYSNKDDFDVPEADLRKHSKHTKTVHREESKGHKVDKAIQRKGVEDLDDENVIKEIDKNDVKRNKKFLTVNNNSAKTKVNHHKLFKNNGLF
ncbi:hypothetical protein ACKWTF_009620 [Chironomus riparius]